MSHDTDTVLATMCKRELLALRCIANDDKDDVIAKVTGLSIHSVPTYRMRVYNALGLKGVRDRIEKRNKATIIFTDWLDRNPHFIQELDWRVPEKVGTLPNRSSADVLLPDPDSICGPPAFVILGSPEADAEDLELRQKGYRPEVVSKLYIESRDEVVMTAIYLKRKN